MHLEGSPNLRIQPKHRATGSRKILVSGKLTRQAPVQHVSQARGKKSTKSYSWMWQKNYIEDKKSDNFSL